MASDFPLHALVWENNHTELDKVLSSSATDDKELKDRHGRTPLMLAVTLGYIECSRVLLQHGADVSSECDGWTIVQEATARGDRDLVHLVLELRDRQRYSTRIGGIPELLQKLKETPDFYVEMRWEFTSWVPLVSRMCPSDTYRVYKRGNSVRVDTTLLGFDQSSWQRGNRTYIFSGNEEGAKLHEIDHDAKMVYVEEMKIETAEELDEMRFSSSEQVQHRLATPLIQTYLDTENISFVRAKGGIFGWGSDKSETICGKECKVFGANNVEIVTKTRTEHMNEDDRAAWKANKNPLLSFFGPSETEERPVEGAGSMASNVGTAMDLHEYLTGIPGGGGGASVKEVGKPKEESKKSQKFRAQLSLCEEYPLSLQEQVMPIVDLLAISNTHFQKLKDFIHMQLPSGFPVKIEIPLFHVLNARITFMNIQSLDEKVDGVTSFGEDSGLVSVDISDSVFEVPKGYNSLGGSSDNQRRQYGGDEEDLLLQYAIRQSLGQDITTNGEDGGVYQGEAPGGNQVDIWEALEGLPPGGRRLNIEDEDRLLQEAIEASMMGHFDVVAENDVVQDSPKDDLQLALEISNKMAEEEEKRRLEEEEIMKKILELSLQEK